MRCLFVIPRMGGGGAERVLANQANVFSKLGHDVTLMTIVGGKSFYTLDDAVKYISADATVNRKNKFTLLFSETIGFVKSFFNFRKNIKTLKPDFVFSQQRQADIICYIVKKSGVKFKHICYEINDPFVRSNITKKILAKIFGDSDLLVCQSKTVKEFYNFVPRCEVIPNPINPKAIPKRVQPSSRRIVAVGRLDKQKNFEMLIDSFAEVVKSIPECTLDIYGEGPLHEVLQRQIDLKGLTESVKLRGACSNVLDLIKDASAFAMSSDYEGMPNALLEAMSIGLPVISTDFKTGVAKELIDKKNGRVVPVGDCQAFAKAIVEVLLDNSIVESAWVESPRKMHDFYNDEIMEKWLSTFNSVCK